MYSGENKSLQTENPNTLDNKNKKFDKENKVRVQKEEDS